MASEAEWAWVAGIVEGEGWIGTGARKAVAVEMTDEDVVRKVHKISGVGRFSGPLPVVKGKAKFRWGVYKGPHLVLLLENIIPWLGARRTQRAVPLLVAARAIKPRVYHRTHAEKLAQQQRWRYTNREKLRAYQRNYERKKKGISTCASA